MPLFVEDDDASPSSALKRGVAYAADGFWLGGRHMKANAAFLDDVRARVPANTPVLVACQKGLRSLSACEQLVRAHSLCTRRTGQSMRACVRPHASATHRYAPPLVPRCRCAAATPR